MPYGIIKESNLLLLRGVEAPPLAYHEKAHISTSPTSEEVSASFEGGQIPHERKAY